MSADGSDEKWMDIRFRFCEEVIDELDSGRTSAVDLQERLKKCEEELKIITREVSALSLFNKNETVSEVPTSSLQYFLVPSYLAAVTQNVTAKPEEKIAALDRAKIYLRDFLERLYSYEIVAFELPWMKEEMDEEAGQSKQKPKFDAAQKRDEKIRRFQQQKQLETNLEELKAQRRLNADDDSLLRDILLSRLRLAAVKAMDDLDYIEEERPLAQRMLMLSKGEINPEPKKPAPRAQKPFIITRDRLQKEVFGLGYPSVPTVTVDEWCEDMVKSGRWDASKNPPETKDEPGSDEDTEAADDARRARAQRWDEYKDDHRRGWGNVHNKG